MLVSVQEMKMEGQTMIQVLAAGWSSFLFRRLNASTNPLGKTGSGFLKSEVHVGS